MSKLCDLISFRDTLAASLDKLSLDSVITSKAALLDTIKIKVQDTKYNNMIDQSKIEYSTLNSTANDIINNLQRLISEINADLDSEADKKFSQDPKDLSAMLYQAPRPLSIDAEVIRLKSTRYVDWRQPGLVIYPRDRTWINPLTGCDPLYIVHGNVQRMMDISLEYPELYQRRLRMYENFDLLPKSAFGFVFSLDLFNFISFNNFEYYLRTIFDLLKPGGVFMFVFNNCDFPDMMDSAENGWINYASQRRIKELSETIGYEVIRFENQKTKNVMHAYESWAEIKKPGTLKTVKAHQALAEILSK